MDFQLSAEQVALGETAALLCERHFPLAGLQAREGRGVDRVGWKALAEAGVFDLRQGGDVGAGLGWADTVVVYQELGRALVPGPVLWTTLAAELGLDAGVVGGVERSPDAAVAHLESLDVLLVLDDDGVWSVDPSEVSARALRPLDPLTPIHAVATLPPGRRVAGAEVAARWRQEGTVLVTALQAGIAHALCAQTRDYVATREQFGRPVGSFQAIKHLVADMFVRAELARVVSYEAGALLDGGHRRDLARRVCSARLVAAGAATTNGAQAIRAYGGMGFTWEVHVHRYLKRAWVLDTMFGTEASSAQHLAALLG